MVLSSEADLPSSVLATSQVGAIPRTRQTASITILQLVGVFASLQFHVVIVAGMIVHGARTCPDSSVAVPPVLRIIVPLTARPSFHTVSGRRPCCASAVAAGGSRRRRRFGIL